jgi:hypothetical protein
MSGPSTILTLPSITSAQVLAKHCVALGCIGVITGTNGVGKTEALKFLARSTDLLPADTKTRYHQCVQAAGASRAVRDILVDLEVRQAVHQRGMALPIALKLALREFTERKIGLLLLDDGDLLSIDSLQGIVSLYDYCRAKNYPLSLILAGATGSEKWIGALPAAWSRTLKVCRLQNLTVELTCALFAGWGPPMSGLAEAVRAKNRDAIGVLRFIHKGVNGNTRRLYYFAELAALDPQSLTPARIKEIMAQMTVTHALQER